jgi:ABC-type transport system involved in cytochrome c biogenesis permease component
MKMFSVIFYFALAIYVISTVLNDPDVISRNKGILISLIVVPIIPTAIHLELRLFNELGTKNA